MDDRKRLLEQQTSAALNYWRLCEDVTVHDAAILIAEANPSDFVHHKPPPGYGAALTPLKIASRMGGYTPRSAMRHEMICGLRRPQTKITERTDTKIASFSSASRIGNKQPSKSKR